jgi:hypothetical protein
MVGMLRLQPVLPLCSQTNLYRYLCFIAALVSPPLIINLGNTAAVRAAIEELQNEVDIKASVRSTMAFVEGHPANNVLPPKKTIEIAHERNKILQEQ